MSDRAGRLPEPERWRGMERGCDADERERKRWRVKESKTLGERNEERWMETGTEAGIWRYMGRDGE